VNKDNFPFFVPFNRSSAFGLFKLTRRQADGSGVTDDQRNNAYGPGSMVVQHSPISAFPFLTFLQLAS
jgi:hypothetical protein